VILESTCKKQQITLFKIDIAWKSENLLHTDEVNWAKLITDFVIFGLIYAVAQIIYAWY